MNRIKKILLLPILCCLCLFSKWAAAFSFVPTEREFLSWDLKCRALYVSTSIGQISPFRSKVAPRDVVFWRHKYSGSAGPWHYCESKIQLQRAKLEFRSQEKKERHLTNAFNAGQYTLIRMDERDPWFAEMAVTMGLILTEKGEPEKAITSFNVAIRHHPTYIPAYSAKALLLSNLNKKDDAISLLLELSQRYSELNLAEVYYFLGLFFLDKGDLVNAKKYADLAYKSGYPLEGLKNKLESLN